MSETILKVNNIHKSYTTGKESFEALRGVSLSLEQGEMLAVMGSSGSGKSTLLHILGAMDAADEGEIRLNGELRKDYGTEPAATRIRAEQIGFIFQDFNLIPSLNVWENIVLPLGLDNRKVKPREVEDILKKIGLQDKKDAMPSALSGGQKQRTAIARALVTRPAIILADEPTGNLDSQTELEVMSLLKSCVSDFGQTLIMITHDETIAQMADEMIIIEDGKAVRR